MGICQNWTNFESKCSWFAYTFVTCGDTFVTCPIGSFFFGSFFCRLNFRLKAACDVFEVVGAAPTWYLRNTSLPLLRRPFFHPSNDAYARERSMDLLIRQGWFSRLILGKCFLIVSKDYT